MKGSLNTAKVCRRIIFFVFKTYYILLAWFLCILSLTGKESGELTFSFRDIKIAEKTIYQNVQYFHEMIYET